MVRPVTVALCLVLGAAAPAVADDLSALLKARQFYNQRDFERAVAAADEARELPDLSDRADLIAARALLERFRLSAAPDELAQARDRLRRIRPEYLGPVEQLEYIVGLGEALYFDAAPGAAAAVFDSVLSSTELLVDGRELVLDWWASAVDQEARPRNEFERQALYGKVRGRMADELARNPSSGSAAYWAAAAARGQGDLNGAWAAAQAGWARAPLGLDRGAALRGDLDRLVQRALIPERARALGQAPDALLGEWEQFKAKWSR